MWKYIRVLILGSDDPEIEDPLMIRPPLAATTASHNGGDDEDEVTLLVVITRESLLNGKDYYG